MISSASGSLQQHLIAGTIGSDCAVKMGTAASGGTPGRCRGNLKATSMPSGS